jgi:porphobilinogen synthase
MSRRLTMGFPIHRMRRLRKNETLRNMVREVDFSVNDFIFPMFVVPGSGIKDEINAIPGNYHFSIDLLVEEVKEVRDLGIPAILLFGVPDKKDDQASGAYAHDGIVQKAIRAVKREVPGIIVITDVCLCEYTPHGHCGIIKDGYVENDATLKLIEKTTLSHVEAGADVVAPAAMMDGQIGAMRKILDDHGHNETVILAYAAKFASKLYDPFFKHGTKSTVAFGDKKSHQMDYANANEALREIALDIEEGADIIMVKPAMFYLDIVLRAKEEFRMPLAVYNVSGEYAMIKSAAEMNRIDEKAIVREIFTSFKRAGADLIISYFAKDAAGSLYR